MEQETKNYESDEVKDLARENLKLTREIHSMTRTIRNYVILQRVLSIIYILIIVIPLILGAIYLPPLIKSFISPYQNLLNTGSSLNSADPNGVENILKQAQKIINDNN